LSQPPTSQVPNYIGPNDCCNVPGHERCCRIVTPPEVVRDAGMFRALAADPDWGHQALEAIRVLAREGSSFTADDVRAVAGSPKVPNVMGAVFAIARQQGLIRLVGSGRSGRGSRRRGRRGVWIGTGAAEQQALGATEQCAREGCQLPMPHDHYLGGERV
jgi:hypothetical protein